MLTVLILIVVYLAVATAVVYIRDKHAEAKDHYEQQVMAAHERVEAARLHARHLGEIERIRQAATEEMIRVAIDCRGETIEGTAIEIRQDRP